MPPTQQCEGALKTQYMQRGEMTERNQQNKEKKVKLLIIMYYNTKIFKKNLFFIRNNLEQYMSFKHHKYFQIA
jgi:hypothetical protein